MPVFNQSFVFDMAQSEEPHRKRAWFSKVDGDLSAKIRIESVPAATKRSSSCHRVQRLPVRAGHQHCGLESGTLSEGLYVEAPCQKSSILR